MIEILVLLKQVFLYIGLPYFICRVIWTEYVNNYYASQPNVRSIPGRIPYFGDLPTILNSVKETELKGDNFHPTFRIFRDAIGMKCGTLLWTLPGRIVLFISDPKILQDLYMTHNKYFDKCPYIG